MGFCPYCGGQSVLYNGTSDAGHPDGLLPFRVSKEQCQEIYTGYLKRIPCVPKALKEKGRVEKFVGVYTPWYAYNAELKTIRIPTKTVTKNTSRYIEYAHNMTEVGINGFYEGAPFDGSSYLDDDIAQGILPFDIKNERDYNPAFISDFYADAANVGESTYLTDAQERMKNDVIAKVDVDILRRENLTKDFTSNDQVALDVGNTGFRKVMYPLWFLTYRTGDRLAYGVVNGDTGADAVIFYIDMDQRILTVFSIGDAQKAISNRTGRSITDNVPGRLFRMRGEGLWPGVRRLCRGADHGACPAHNQCVDCHSGGLSNRVYLRGSQPYAEEKDRSEPL